MDSQTILTAIRIYIHCTSKLNEAMYNISLEKANHYDLDAINNYRYASLFNVIPLKVFNKSET